MSHSSELLNLRVFVGTLVLVARHPEVRVVLDTHELAAGV